MSNLFLEPNIQSLDEIEQEASHKIFVEGNKNSLDPTLLKILLAQNGLSNIDVSPMGGCENIHGAALALYPHHSTYYFLIDRDHRTSEYVEKFWENFPNPDTHNLLIWRKHEFENYFINPDYIQQSKYLTVSNIKLKKNIQAACNQRIFLDAVNLTTRILDEKTQKISIPTFKATGQRKNCEIEDFKDQKSGENQLLNLPHFLERSSEVTELLHTHNIQKIYSDHIQELTGGKFPLEYGIGTWLEEMAGKEILTEIFDSCFRVKEASGKTIQKPEFKYRYFIKDLLRKPLEQQPADFQQLVEKLKTKIQQSNGRTS